MAKVAFLGLGVMGFPMAGHLAAKGHEVTVYNRTFAIVPSREIRPVRGAAAIIEAKCDCARGCEVGAENAVAPRG